jgi:hypothetical protein
MGTFKRSAFVQVRPMRRFSEDHQMKDEALKLASALDHWATQMDMGRKPDPKSLIRKASAELRRLQAELDAIKQALAAQHEPENEPFVSLASVQEPVGLIDRLTNPEQHYEFNDQKKANAVLMSLCQEAADALAAPVQATMKLESSGPGHGPAPNQKLSVRHVSLIDAGKTPPVQPAVPDALNPKDENPAYAAGWNDCRAEMLKGNTP